MTPHEFLLARLAEDKAVAVRAAETGAKWATMPMLTDPTREPEQSMVFWRVDRALADCDAKRRVVESCVDDGWPDGDSLAARILAAVYADHPDYQEAWRP